MGVGLAISLEQRVASGIGVYEGLICVGSLLLCV